MIEIKTDNIEGLENAAREFIGLTKPGRIYAFYGQMGAGKTTFISEVVRQLESDDEANSPTFSIVNVYDTGKWGRIYHLDCYRLEDEEEALDMGIEDYFAAGNTAFVEWPEQVEAFLPEDAVTVKITVTGDGKRVIEIED